MDHRIRTSRELAIQLAHAKSIISVCRQNIVRLDVEDEDFLFVSLRIARMISDLEAMKKYTQKQAALWEELKVANETAGDTDDARSVSQLHMGRGADINHISCADDIYRRSCLNRKDPIHKLA